MLKFEDYVTLITDALRRAETVVIACRCTIRYSGRAESFLERGDRVVLIKCDTTLLVHQPMGSAPINYMKPQTTHALSVEKDLLFLKCNNLLDKESMEIKMDKVYFFNSYKLEDGQTIVVAGTEEDMSDMIYANPHVIEDGFKPVSQEEQTRYGFIDVLGVDKQGVLTIVECKRYCAELSAVTQLRRYVEKVMVSKGITKVRGILAAPKITENAKKMLEDWGFEFKSINPPKYFEEFDKKQARLDAF
ncbi:MAG TPA: endonuclease NucS [Candidatus Nanoarchaeia archaeon]|nr:endonuclease NucS [Candidatus Nanoarchaeia archaeon]